MKTAFVVLAAVASVSAHSTWQQLWVGSTDKADSCARTVKDNNPIDGVNSADMFCGRGPKSQSGVCEVAGKPRRPTFIYPKRDANTTLAGESLTVEMHAQPGERSCSQPAIGGNHYGPVMVYMAKVADAKTATSGSFFKVAEDGYTGTTASWGTEILNANCGKRAFTVPKSIAAGDYLVRAEAIALHAGAGNEQPYVTCFQVKVTGGGSANPAGVSFPGGYKKSDTLFQKAIYDQSFTYVSPGPAVYSG
jgi:lytic cellulose monooxygenase (C1-hydroxylating)